MVNPDQFRAGIAYVGYKNLRVGIDSERFVRHPVQNGWHGLLRGVGNWLGGRSNGVRGVKLRQTANFKVLNLPTKFYGVHKSRLPYSGY